MRVPIRPSQRSGAVGGTTAAAESVTSLAQGLTGRCCGTRAAFARLTGRVGGAHLRASTSSCLNSTLVTAGHGSTENRARVFSCRASHGGSPLRAPGRRRWDGRWRKGPSNCPALHSRRYCAPLDRQRVDRADTDRPSCCRVIEFMSLSHRNWERQAPPERFGRLQERLQEPPGAFCIDLIAWKLTQPW